MWMKLCSTTLSVGILLLLSCASPNADTPPVRTTNEAGKAEQLPPVPGKNSLWVDVEDVVMADRLEWRPGNFVLLGVISDFLSGLYELRPALKAVVFPCDIKGRRYENADEYDKWLKRREDQILEGEDFLRNKLRSYVLQVKTVSFYSLDAGVNWQPQLKGIGVPDFTIEDILDVGKRHAGKAVIVRATIHFESLQSEKIEGELADSFTWLLLTESQGMWGVCFYSN